MNYEYGIAHVTVDIDENGNVTSLHRKGMAEWLADQWIKDWEKDGGAKGIFVKVRCSVPKWEVVE